MMFSHLIFMMIILSKLRLPFPRKFTTVDCKNSKTNFTGYLVTFSYCNHFYKTRLGYIWVSRAYGKKRFLTDIFFIDFFLIFLGSSNYGRWNAVLLEKPQVVSDKAVKGCTIYKMSSRDLTKIILSRQLRVSDC